MYRACIAVVDAARARLFAFQRSSEVEGIREQMTERRDLVNPARRRRPAELFSDSRPGMGRTGPLQYGLDDHRDAHIDRLDAGFARSVSAEIEDLLRTTGAQRLILCASPPMLGTLRAVGPERWGAGMQVETLARDLVKLTPTQLRERLESYRLLPPRPPRAAASSPA